MASTDDGKRLTEAHRQAQLAVSARAATEARGLWEQLDPFDLDGSTPYWLAANTIRVDRRARESQQLASAYLTEYRTAEVGRPGEVVLRVPSATAQALLLAGPVRVKKLIKAGVDREDAHEQAFTKYAGIVRRQTLMGGRLTIAATAGRDRIARGWRRVTDGDPCSFCAMLASRGPAYTSAATAQARNAEGLRYHGNCGCTAEIIYGTWTPTPQEADYVDRYEEAAAEAETTTGRRGLDDILRIMRRDGSFRDSASRRTRSS